MRLRQPPHEQQPASRGSRTAKRAAHPGSMPGRKGSRLPQPIGDQACPPGGDPRLCEQHLWSQEQLYFPSGFALFWALRRAGGDKSHVAPGQGPHGHQPSWREPGGIWLPGRRLHRGLMAWRASDGPSSHWKLVEGSDGSPSGRPPTRPWQPGPHAWMSTLGCSCQKTWPPLSLTSAASQPRHPRHSKPW